MEDGGWGMNSKFRVWSLEFKVWSKTQTLRLELLYLIVMLPKPF